MTQARFIHDGKAVDYTPTVAIAAGDVVVQGDLVGIAKLDIEVGKLGALATVGVFDIAKATGASTGIAVGALVYWDNAAKQATATATDNTLLGKVIATATDADETVRVRLNQ